jgi:hypothetical protein
MITPDGRSEIEATFGRPAKSNGMLNEAWEGEFIRKVAPPNAWQLFYQDDLSTGQKMIMDCSHS